jgi:hypothetical protein
MPNLILLSSEDGEISDARRTRTQGSESREYAPNDGPKSSFITRQQREIEEWKEHNYVAASQKLELIQTP